MAPLPHVGVPPLRREGSRSTTVKHLPPEVKDRLLENTRRSVEHGTFGAPTFFVGEEIFFGKDRLRDVEELIMASHSLTAVARRRSQARDGSRVSG
jgi:transposase